MTTARLLVVSQPPHIPGPFSTRRIMLDVLIALTPAFLAALYYFGVGAFLVTATAVVCCLATEYLIQKFLLRKEPTINDLSAVVTGVLLAMNLPSNIPLGMVAAGSIFAIGIAKMCYGGLGHNPFNPALMGRVFLLMSFPVAMTSWPKPLINRFSVDAVTGPTPLAIIKEGLHAGQPLGELMPKIPGYLDLFLGNRGGCLGEVSILAILLGLAYLLYRQVITWHIPVIAALSAFLLSGLFWIMTPGSTPDPFFHLLTGGLIFGIVFMATDYTTSPMTVKGMCFYAAAIGILTILIRSFGSYPEGMSFAILIMNAFVPLINKLCKPYRFGEGKI